MQYVSFDVIEQPLPNTITQGEARIHALEEPKVHACCGQCPCAKNRPQETEHSCSCTPSPHHSAHTA